MGLLKIKYYENTKMGVSICLLMMQVGICGKITLPDIIIDNNLRDFLLFPFRTDNWE